MGVLNVTVSINVFVVVSAGDIVEGGVAEHSDSVSDSVRDGVPVIVASRERRSVAVRAAVKLTESGTRVLEFDAVAEMPRRANTRDGVNCSDTVPVTTGVSVELRIVETLGPAIEVDIVSEAVEGRVAVD